MPPDLAEVLRGMNFHRRIIIEKFAKKPAVKRTGVKNVADSVVVFHASYVPQARELEEELGSKSEMAASSSAESATRDPWTGRKSKSTFAYKQRELGTPQVLCFGGALSCSISWHSNRFVRSIAQTRGSEGV